MTAGYLARCGLLEHAITPGGAQLSDVGAMIAGALSRPEANRRGASRTTRHVGAENVCPALTAAVKNNSGGRGQAGLSGTACLAITKACPRPSRPKRHVAPFITARFDSYAKRVYGARNTLTLSGRLQQDDDPDTLLSVKFHGATHTSGQQPGPSSAAKCYEHGQSNSTSANVTPKSPAPSDGGPAFAKLLAGEGPRQGRGPRRGSERDTRLSLDASAMSNSKGTQC